jgi:hypothetical protein
MLEGASLFYYGDFYAPLREAGWYTSGGFVV